MLYGCVYDRTKRVWTHCDQKAKWPSLCHQTPDAYGNLVAQDLRKQGRSIPEAGPEWLIRRADHNSATPRRVCPWLETPCMGRLIWCSSRLGPMTSTSGHYVVLTRTWRVVRVRLAGTTVEAVLRSAARACRAPPGTSGPASPDARGLDPGPSRPRSGADTEDCRHDVAGLSSAAPPKRKR